MKRSVSFFAFPSNQFLFHSFNPAHAAFFQGKKGLSFFFFFFYFFVWILEQIFFARVYFCFDNLYLFSLHKFHPTLSCKKCIFRNLEKLFFPDTFSLLHLQDTYCPSVGAKKVWPCNIVFFSLECFSFSFWMFFLYLFERFSSPFWITVRRTLAIQLNTFQ